MTVGLGRPFGDSKKSMFSKEIDLNKVRCQKCWEMGHWTFQCKGKRKLVMRPSRTSILNKRLKTSHSLAARTQSPQNNVKKKHKDEDDTEEAKGSSSSSSDSSSESDSSSSSSDDESSSSSSSSSDSSSSSSYYSSSSSESE